MADKWSKKPAGNVSREVGQTNPSAASSNGQSGGSAATTSEYSTTALRLMDETKLQGLLFNAIRECDIPTIKNILHVNRSLVTAKMYGFEGADLYNVIKDKKTERCYQYTGLEKSGFFYPLHVAAEAGHKKLTFLLVKAGADVNAVDSRGDTAEKKCNGDALHAFYELRGLVYKETERYEGLLDREGRSTGQGTIFYKPEGYLSQETVLYRGGFKYGLYHGHGTLFWPGTSTVRYVGRFSKGLMHGRGLEFDKKGQKLYQGAFHHGLRDGRGIEYSEGQVLYRGEFSKGSRHGFGVFTFGPSHRYIGRYESNAMAGLGILCYPNGDRFEGMFYDSKRDGPGSFYQKESSSSKSNAVHALWQKDMKIKDLTIGFVPKSVDLPDDSSASLLSAMAADEEKILKDIERSDVNLDEIVHATGVAGTRKYSAHVQSKSHINVDWKVTVARYCRLTLKEALSIGIENSHELGFVDDVEPNAMTDDDEGNDLAEDMMNEVNGVHFIDFTELFVAYIYVNSASKVFEGRIASTHMAESVPDFEAVYHVVVDAVETYNDTWEHQYRLQEDRLEHPEAETHVKDESVRQIDSKRKVFMGEREQQREEELLLRRQRAALAAKKGQGQLEPDIERRIQTLSYNSLEEELMKLLVDESGKEAEASNRNTGGHYKDDIPTKTGKQSKKKSKEIVSPSHEESHDMTKDSHKLSGGSINAVTNEFASELLHIIRTSRSIMM